jgi:thiamine-phosphate pyrophosphorylase
MRGLYAIVDVTTLHRLGLPVVEVAAAIAQAGPVAIQLRAKSAAACDVLALLRSIHPICRQLGVPLFANDRVDLAVLSGCEGVHLGQDDLPVVEARRIAPHLRIGISTHNLEQLDRAVRSHPDYVAYGPVYATRSKLDPDVAVGLDGLRDARRRCPLPLVAIGGIDLARAPEVSAIGAVGAVIAALLPGGVASGDLSPIGERARLLHAALSAAPATP